MTQTFLEAINILSRLGFIQVVAPLLLVWAIVYALLVRSKFFKPDIAALISFAFAMIVIITPEAREFIQIISPFFAMLLIILMMIVLMFLMLGANAGDVANVIGKGPVQYVVIVMSLIFVFAALGQVFGKISPFYNQTGEANETGALVGGSGQSQIDREIIYTLTDPGFLGVVILLALFGLTVYTITKGP